MTYCRPIGGRAGGPARSAIPPRDGPPATGAEGTRRLSCQGRRRPEGSGESAPGVVVCRRRTIDVDDGVDALGSHRGPPRRVPARCRRRRSLVGGPIRGVHVDHPHERRIVGRLRLRRCARKRPDGGSVASPPGARPARDDVDRRRRRPCQPAGGRHISILPISTFDTDYILVHEPDFDAAVDALTLAGHVVVPSSQHIPGRA